MKRSQVISTLICGVAALGVAAVGSAEIAADEEPHTVVPADATPYLAPGATKMGLRKGDRIYYEDGAVIVTLPSAALAAWSCPSGYVCLYDFVNGTGERVQFADAGYWQNLHQYNFGDRAESWRNAKSANGVWIDEHTGGGGWHYCFNPGQGNLQAADRNEASRIYIRLSPC